MSVTFSAYTVNAEGQYNWLAPEGFVPQYEMDDYLQVNVQTNQNPWELNVSNSNFQEIMNLLGYENVGYCGSLGDGSLQDFRDKVTFALEGVRAMPELDGPVQPEVDEDYPNFIQCGRLPGYMHRVLPVLFEIASAAITAGATVSYA